MFTADGFWARRASQRRFILLKKIDLALRSMLRPRERVLFLTSGVSYSFWESYFLGLPMYFLNRRAIALTSQRFLLIQISFRGRPKALRSQIGLDAVERLARTGLSNTLVRVSSGQRYVFSYIPKADRKTLVAVFQSANAALPRSDRSRAMEHLCPHCYAEVAGYPAACPECRGALKSATKAGLLSLLFPGLGDLYLGHKGMATFELVVVALIWLGVMLPDPELPATAFENAVAGVFLFAFLHIPDAIATRYIGRKGQYPAGESPPRPAARSASAA
jgi:hypothetical protein